MSDQTTLKPKRMPEKMTQDRSELDRLFAGTILAHVAAIDDRLVIHGSTGSGWMRALEGQEAAVTITRATGIVVARSMFESSIHYASAMVFGRFSRVGSELHEEYLERLTDRILPGRSSETRASLRKELAATMLLAMPIEEWSLRVSEGDPEDTDDDIAGDTWGGTITLDGIEASARASHDLRPGIPQPASVAEFLRHPRGIL